MKPRTAARKVVEQAFSDKGVAVLRAARLPESWREALADVPLRVLKKGLSRDLDGRPQGERVLEEIRAHWARNRNFRPAVAVTRALMEKRHAELGPEHPETLAELGYMGALADNAGKADEAERLLPRAYNLMRQATADRDLRLAVIATNLGRMRARQRRFSEAEEYLSRALKIRQELDPSSTARVAGQLGEVYLRQKKYRPALPVLEESWKRFAEERGRSHKRTLGRARLYANTLMKLDRRKEALPLLKDILAAARERGDGEQVAATAFELANVYESLDDHQPALRLMRESLDWTRMQQDHPTLSSRLAGMARLLLKDRQLREAEGLLREAAAIDERRYGTDSPQAAVRYAMLGHVAYRTGRFQEAMGWLEPAAALLRSAKGDDDPQARMAVEFLALTLAAEAERLAKVGARDTAKALKEHGMSMASKVLGNQHKTMDRLRSIKV